MNEDSTNRAGTPRMESRPFTDEDGRRWSGSVLSGQFAGGEARAEVIFVCEDTPGETKRCARLQCEPAQAADVWRAMSEDDVRTLFRGSEPVKP